MGVLWEFYASSMDRDVGVLGMVREGCNLKNRTFWGVWSSYIVPIFVLYSSYIVPIYVCGGV